MIFKATSVPEVLILGRAGCQSKIKYEIKLRYLLSYIKSFNTRQRHCPGFQRA